MNWIFSGLEVVEECESTNDWLLARKGERDFNGKAVLAKKQTAGRGRRGRTWQDIEGNLALSVGFVLEAELASSVPFWVGVALHETIKKILFSKIDLRLKWPNDLYADEKKISGILTQGRQMADKMAVVVGIGLNIVDCPAEATCLKKLGVEGASPDSVARLFLHQLEADIAYRNADSMRAEWQRRARITDSPIVVVGEPDRIFWPIGLSGVGELIVRDQEGSLRHLCSEEVSIRWKV